MAMAPARLSCCCFVPIAQLLSAVAPVSAGDASGTKALSEEKVASIRTSIEQAHDAAYSLWHAVHGEACAYDVEHFDHPPVVANPVARMFGIPEDNLGDVEGAGLIVDAPLSSALPTDFDAAHNSVRHLGC